MHTGIQICWISAETVWEVTLKLLNEELPLALNYPDWWFSRSCVYLHLHNIYFDRSIEVIQNYFETSFFLKDNQ